jgi:alanine racemase
MSNKDVQEISTRDARLGLRTWIEIDTKAIENNYQIFRSLLKPETKLLSVVKSNAYGHGLVDFSKHIEKLGIDWLAADAVVEALRLRKEGIEVPILVLGYTLPERMQEAINNNISLTISNMYALQGLKQLGLEGKMKIHIKVDSGMHRQGFMEDELDAVLEFLLKHKNEIEVEGLYTHFASAKDPTQIVETTFQVKVFEQWIHAFKKAGFKPLVHAAATGAAILFPETHYDMVRIGIGLHGLWPSAEVQAHRQKEMPLMPTLSWKTIVSEIKTLPTGSKIGYDFTHTVHRETVMAVCPIGYWHGYSRSLSNIGNVLIHGIRVKVLGRVSMDMLVIDITDIPQTKIGDEVVLIGASEDNYLSAHDVALLSGVSTYEFVTRINPLIKKIYL